MSEAEVEKYFKNLIISKVNLHYTEKIIFNYIYIIFRKLIKEMKDLVKDLHEEIFEKRKGGIIARVWGENVTLEKSMIKNSVNKMINMVKKHKFVIDDAAYDKFQYNTNIKVFDDMIFKDYSVPIFNEYVKVINYDQERDTIFTLIEKVSKLNDFYFFNLSIPKLSLKRGDEMIKVSEGDPIENLSYVKAEYFFGDLTKLKIVLNNDKEYFLDIEKTNIFKNDDSFILSSVGFTMNVENPNLKLMFDYLINCRTYSDYDDDFESVMVYNRKKSTENLDYSFGVEFSTKEFNSINENSYKSYFFLLKSSTVKHNLFFSEFLRGVEKGIANKDYYPKVKKALEYIFYNELRE